MLGSACMVAGVTGLSTNGFEELVKVEKLSFISRFVVVDIGFVL